MGYATQADYARTHAGYEFHVFTRPADKSVTDRWHVMPDCTPHPSLRIVRLPAAQPPLQSSHFEGATML